MMRVIVGALYARCGGYCVGAARESGAALTL
jgi:hypothetical protein